MITIEQCRAARGLLGWTQQDLADASGLSKTAINNYEKGHSDIKSDSLRAIRMAFEGGDIEFMPHDGVRRKIQQTRILRGPETIQEILDDIKNTLSKADEECLILNAGPHIIELLEAHGYDLEKRNMKLRILCAHTDHNPASSVAHMQHKYLDIIRLDGAYTAFIYGPKVAFELWERRITLLVDNQEAASAERQRFEYLWGKAEAPAMSGKIQNSHSA